MEMEAVDENFLNSISLQGKEFCYGTQQNGKILLN